MIKSYMIWTEICNEIPIFLQVVGTFLRAYIGFVQISPVDDGNKSILSSCNDLINKRSNLNLNSLMPYPYLYVISTGTTRQPLIN
jgi:hypothetical protein